MKRTTLIPTFLILIVCISGCNSRENQTQSATFSNFSLGAIVFKQEGYLQAEARVLSGAETGPTVPPYQKHEEMIVRIDASNLPEFLAGIEGNIESVIIENGGVIVGSSSSQGLETGNADLTYFSYHYSQGEINGVIHLYGVPGVGTVYYLISVLSES